MTTARTGTIGRIAYYLLTGGLAIIFLFPLLWSLAASVSPQASTGQVNGVGLGNYTTLFNYGAGLPQFLFNSTFVAALTVAITLAVSTLGGYAFARFKFPGRDALFLLTLAIAAPAPAAAQGLLANWPQWRGPKNDGLSTEKNLPVEWNTEKNVVGQLAYQPCRLIEPARDIHDDESVSAHHNIE